MRLTTWSRGFLRLARHGIVLMRPNRFIIRADGRREQSTAIYSLVDHPAALAADPYPEGFVPIAEQIAMQWVSCHLR
jgi:hypothetical protein